MTSELIDILGHHLLTKSGQSDTRDVLSDKSYFLLYFASQWSVPCQQFHPYLLEFYSLTQSSFNLEIIYVSSDHTHHEFNEYYSQMPWVAIPYNSPQTLSFIYSISDLPSLVIVDRTGKVINYDGCPPSVNIQMGLDSLGAKYPNA